MMKRWIMHVDMDAFYASVEQHDNPEYQGRPLIVGGLSSRGVVAACSYEARAFGVKSAMAGWKAKQLCPEAIFLWPRMERYQEVSHQIHRIMRDFTPYIEPLALDEAFLDISGMGKLYEGPYHVGKAIKERILEETGLVASVGIGPNKFLAKIGSDIDKPDGLVVIPHTDAKRFVAPLPISRLWGVGQQLEKVLRGGGFQTIGDIADLPDASHLVPYCGNQSERIYLMAQGIDDRPVEYDRAVKSIGNELTYIEDLLDPSDIDREWRYFAHRVAKRLRNHGLKGHTVTIKVRQPDFSTMTKQKKLDYATDREDVLYETSQMLYNKIQMRPPYRLMGLTVSGFEGTVAEQSLFHEVEDAPKEALVHAIDELEAKFGSGVVMTGALWERRRQQQANVETTFLEKRELTFNDEDD